MPTAADRLAIEQAILGAIDLHRRYPYYILRRWVG